MMKKMVCLFVALLFVFVAVNVATADDVVVQTEVSEGVVINDQCPCSTPVYDPCAAPVVYRRGLFGLYYRPVIAAPVVVAPAYYPAYPRYVRPYYPAYPAYYW